MILLLNERGEQAALAIAHYWLHAYSTLNPSPVIDRKLFIYRSSRDHFAIIFL